MGMEWTTALFLADFAIRLVVGALLVRSVHARLPRRSPVESGVPAKVWLISLVIFMVFQPPLIFLLVLFALSRGLGNAMGQAFGRIEESGGSGEARQAALRKWVDEVSAAPAGQDADSRFGALNRDMPKPPIHRHTPGQSPVQGEGPVPGNRTASSGLIREDRPWWQFW